MVLRGGRANQCTTRSSPFPSTQRQLSNTHQTMWHVLHRRSCSDVQPNKNPGLRRATIERPPGRPVYSLMPSDDGIRYRLFITTATNNMLTMRRVAARVRLSQRGKRKALVVLHWRRPDSEENINKRAALMRNRCHNGHATGLADDTGAL